MRVTLVDGTSKDIYRGSKADQFLEFITNEGPGLFLRELAQGMTANGHLDSEYAKLHVTLKFRTCGLIGLINRRARHYTFNNL